MQQVDDLLLAEVAAAGRAVGRQPERAQLLLVRLGVGAGGEEQHDLARASRRPRRRARARGAATCRASARRQCSPGSPYEALSVTSSSTGCPKTGSGNSPDAGERLEAVAELVAEEVVDRGEHLGPRAVVLGQRQPLRRALRRRSRKTCDVGVAEAVDRLELVADEEDLLRGPAGEQVDQVALERVRVLELVDHDRAEAELLGLADLLVVAASRSRASSWRSSKSSADSRSLAARVLGGEQVEQLLEEVLSRAASSSSAACSTRLRASSKAPAARGPQARSAVEVDQRLGASRKVERGARRRALARRSRRGRRASRCAASRQRVERSRRRRARRARARAADPRSAASRRRRSASCAGRRLP